MEEERIASWALALDKARLAAAPVGQISATSPGWVRADAYAVQERGMGLRLERGERRVGFKMGLTSEAKRRQMNLDSPLYGELTDRMRVAGAPLPLPSLIHPKAEPELAFLTGAELAAGASREEALAAVAEVHACLEVLDSRYDRFEYFSMEDVIADNSSSSHFVLGDPLPPGGLDLAALDVRLEVDGETVAEGVSSAISGDPVLSLVLLCRLLGERGRTLPAGSLVLAGAATPAHPLRPGVRVAARVSGLGAASLDVAG